MRDGAVEKDWPRCSEGRGGDGDKALREALCDGGSGRGLGPVADGERCCAEQVCDG